MGSSGVTLRDHLRSHFRVTRGHGLGSLGVTFWGHTLGSHLHGGLLVQTSLQPYRDPNSKPSAHSHPHPQIKLKGSEVRGQRSPSWPGQPSSKPGFPHRWRSAAASPHKPRRTLGPGVLPGVKGHGVKGHGVRGQGEWGQGSARANGSGGQRGWGSKSEGKGGGAKGQRSKWVGSGQGQWGQGSGVKKGGVRAGPMDAKLMGLGSKFGARGHRRWGQRSGQGQWEQGLKRGWGQGSEVKAGGSQSRVKGNGVEG